MTARMAVAATLSALLLLAACGGEPAADEPTATPSPVPTPEPTPATTADRIASIEYPAGMVDGRRVGDADAPVHLEVFVDFRCPHCMRFTALIEPMLVDEYVREGHLLLEIRDYPVLGPDSVSAAAAARCAASQDRFWDYHKGLFIAQSENRSFGDALYMEIASDYGLEMDAFEECYSYLYTLADVSDDRAEAQSLGLPGTPSFVVNGEPLAQPPSSLSEWREFLDALLR